MKTSMRLSPALLTFAVSFLGHPLSFVCTAPAAVIHVKTNGNDTLPGTSWADAKRTVNSALSAATTSDEIWIACGAYAERITLGDGRALYGGFAGTETAREERNWKTNFSTLYGEFGGVVVLITNAGPSTRVDGLVIAGGQGIHGGGIKTSVAGPVIANNTIRNNLTDGAGAGISVWGFLLISSTQACFPVITNNVIVENQSINDEGDGGGIAVIGSSPLIAGNRIARNTAARNGGGIVCWRHSFPIIANNAIEANSASYDELTVTLGGGGIFASATDLDGRPIPFAISAPVIINNVIAANGGYYGGGITVVDSDRGAATIANNTIVANNGTGVFWSNTWPTNDNNIIAYNTRGFERGLAGTSDAVIRYNNVYGNRVLGAAANYTDTADRTGTAGNISADPRFANWAIGEFHLQPDSPCVGAGSTALAPTNWLDFDGEARVQGAGVDMGADESAGSTWNVPTPVIFVSPNGSDADGRSWATAKRSVTNGIALAAQTGGEVWVAEGTYLERIQPPAFVRLYGGFAGDETQRAARLPAAHPTILDGGGVAPVVYYRNAGYRASAVDGFTVQGGGIYTGGNVFHPDLTNRFGGRGGGIYCRVSGPVIANNLIQSNSLGSPFNSFESFGGGMYCYQGHAEITGNTFTENEVLKQMNGNGGGIYCLKSMVNIDGNVFHRNHALDGAAIYGNYSALRVARNLIQSNALHNVHPLPTYMGSGDGAMTFWFARDLLIEANLIQGNVADSGAGLCLLSPFAARVQNNLIVDNLAWDYSGNSGGQGGGMLCEISANATSPVIIANNTLVGNSAPPSILGHFGGGLALTLYTNALILANNVIASNSSGIWRYPYLPSQPVLQNNCLNNSNGVDYVNVPAGPADVQADPHFVNRMAGDFRLALGSPCIDTGTSASAPALDFNGVARPLDGDTNGVPRADLGAFEFVHPFADTDRDGMRDAAELIAGTDPIDPAACLRATLNLLGATGPVAVSWPSVIGRIYHVESSISLAPGANWQTVSNNIAADGGRLTVQDLWTAPANRFYRIGVRLAP